MSTSTDLKENSKPVIRKIYSGKTLSINIPLELSRAAKLSKGDYVYSYLDSRNRLIFERVNVEKEVED